MVTSTNHVVARAGFTLLGDPGALRIFATSFCQIQVKTKKSLTILALGPGTVPYGKSGPGYCIAFIKRLDDGLR